MTCGACALQGANISPNLIVIGPYDTTVAGQVWFTPVHHPIMHFSIIKGPAGPSGIVSCEDWPGHSSEGWPRRDH